MSKAYSIKADNKLNLFTWDIETEYQNVDRWISSEPKTDQSILDRKRTQLRQLKLDFHDIIISKTVTEAQLNRIFELARQGGSGVWEQATTTIERLAFHFDLVKSKLTEELSDGDSNYVSKLVTSVGVFYDRRELTERLSKLLMNKSNKVKKRSLNKIYELRVVEMKSELIQLRNVELNKSLIDLIDFTLKYISTSTRQKVD